MMRLRRLCRKKPLFPWPILFGLTLAACAGPALQPTGGGLPSDEAAQISLVVAQTRAQFPALSATGIPFEQRAPTTASKNAQLVLKGKGSGVSPGLQLGGRAFVTVKLFLSKPGYNAGRVEITPTGGSPEIWRILAFDQRGHGDGDFEFLYTLVGPQGKLRYLAVVGGTFKREGRVHRGFEGTLIEPGKDGRVENWRRAFKIDFGYRFPVKPAYQGQVAQAQKKFEEMERRLRNVQSLRDRIVPLEKNLAAQKKQKTKGAAEDASRTEAQLKDLNARFAEDLERTEKAALEYYGLRKKIALAYAAFVESNLYRWGRLSEQVDFYEAWQPVEFHHPRIDKMSDALVALLKNPTPLSQARKAALAEIERRNNWDKNPMRAKTAR